MKKKLHREACRRRLGSAGIPGRYLEKTFDQFDSVGNVEAFAIVSEWSRAPAGWIYLHGKVGTGKTHLGCAAISRMIMMGISAMMSSAPDIVWELMPDRRGDADGLIKTLMEIDVLGMDDIGAQRETPFATECIFRIVNRRYMAGLPTIFTSNWSLRDMARQGADWIRVADRINEMVKPNRLLELRGGSKR